jgi:phosphatidylinositol glycan class N
MMRTLPKVPRPACYICEYWADRNADATELDIWSLDHLKKLLDAASTNSTLDRELREEKVVFFLHLLGLDTTGHSYRPFSKVKHNLI